MRVFGDMLGGVGYQLERLFERTKGRLFRKYAALLVALVGTALVLSTAIETYYSFHENREASAAVQREKAVGAATIIEQFLKEIEGQVGWTTHASFVPGQSGADQRRFDFLRLFRQAPAVTEVSYIDGQGREQLKVSRLSMDVIGSNIDRSLEPHFKEAKSRRRHVGEVYFRKESEPYLTLSVGGTGRNVGVAVAEVNLKFIWDVISRLKVGRTGAAYVIDNRGLLIAHQDIGLVLRKTDLSALTHVAAAREARPAPGIGVAFPEIVRDPQGREVLTAFAAIETLGWNVFVDLPVKEAYEPVYASMMRSGVVLLGGLGLAGLAGMWLAQRMVVPIRTLATGAAKIGAGDLDYRLAIKTGDEVEALADGFNEMGARLKESYQGLERKVETRTRELQSSLVRQTAMSEVLAVISSSPGQVEPVFEAILSSARRLCNAGFGHFLLFDGERWHAEALQNVPPAYAEFWRKEPVIAGPETNLGRVQRSGKFDQVEDVLLGQGYRSRAPLGVATAELGGARTLLTVPLIKKHKIIGAIALYRTDVCAFDNSEILLLETFADQAVIAIENTRLFEEVQTRTRELARSVSELEALGEVGRAVSSTLDLEQVLETVVRKARDLGTAEGAAIFRYKESDDTFRLWHSSGLDFVLEDQVRGLKLKAEDTLMARAIKTRQALQLDDIERGPENALRKLALTAGFRSALFVPLARADRAFGVLVLQRRQTGSFDDATISLLQTFASQSVLAIQNARLFREIEEKGLQLAVASKHKSQFLANMSHELRTPLNAVLGYTELIQDGVYGAMPAKVNAVLDRVQSNGRHLLGLINDVLDLSKIEAGQLELSIGEYSMKDVVQTVVAATESLASTKNLPIHIDVTDTLPRALGDERRLSQVLLNLLGNAIKFTDVGEIRIVAVAENGHFSVSIADTGPGIPQSEQSRIFDEFHQVDSSNTKVKGGTGLGLAISRRIVKLHGGSISVASVVGQGSTFTVELPVRVEEQVGTP